MAGDFVMCEFCSNHDVTKSPAGILTEPLQITQAFEDDRRWNAQVLRYRHPQMSEHVEIPLSETGISEM
jgi:hypothetical protein